MKLMYVNALSVSALLIAAASAQADTVPGVAFPYTVTGSGVINAGDLQEPQSQTAEAAIEALPLPLLGLQVDFTAEFDVDMNNATSTGTTGDGAPYYSFNVDNEDVNRFEPVFTRSGTQVFPDFAANGVTIELDDNLSSTQLWGVPFVDPDFTSPPFAFVDPETTYDVVTVQIEAFGENSVLEMLFSGLFASDLFDLTAGPSAPVLSFAALAAGPLTTAFRINELGYDVNGFPNPDDVLNSGYYSFGLFDLARTSFEPLNANGEPTLEFASQAVVPVPASLPLLLAGIGALAFARSRARKAA